MKTNDKDTFKVPEKSSYKRKYLVRKLEEKEAEELIKKFKEDNENKPDGGEPPTNIRN